MKKILVSILLLAMILAGWRLFYSNTEKALMAVSFLDVGQGDAILVQTPYGQNVLIDGGPDNTILRRLSERLSWWDRRIDLMVLTHPHDDHVTGLIEVMKRYDVKKIIYTGALHEGPNYLAWSDEVRKRDIPTAVIDRPQTVNFGPDCGLEILWPTADLSGKSAPNLNNTSIVARLTYRDTSLLLTGDAESEVENSLAQNGDIHSDVLKISHHGSDNATSDDFLTAVDPDISVISVGKDNDFGHPSLRTLKKLERAGKKVFRTDMDASVLIVSDGNNIWKE